METANGADIPGTQRTSEFLKNIGSPHFLDVMFDPAAEYHATIRYTIPLEWCHSYDPSQPIGTAEGDDNLPVVQGGLVASCIDNAMTSACRIASGGPDGPSRFQTTLSITVEFLRGMRPGYVWAKTRAGFVGGTVAFAEVTMYGDEEMTRAVAKASSTNKLLSPSKL